MMYSNSLEEGFWRRVLPLIAHPGALNTLLLQLVTEIIQLFEVDFGAVYLLDRRTDELVLQVKKGKQGNYRPLLRLRRGQGITGMAAYQEKVLQVDHIQEDPRAVQYKEEYDFKSIVAVPLIDGNDLLGVINLQSREVRHFSEAEMYLLEEVVQQVFVVGIRAARTLAEMRRRANQIQALNELGQAMNSGLELDESLELIASKAAEALNAKGAAIRLVVEDGSLAQATIFFSIDSTNPEIAHEQRIAEYVAASGEPIQIDDLRTDRHPQARGSGLVCVPLVLEERVVGTLALFDKTAFPENEGRAFTFDDFNMLFALSSQIAAEIEDIRLTKRLQILVLNEKNQGEELRLQYNRSRALLESISDGLLAVGPNGEVVEANTVARRLFGIRQLEGRMVTDLVEDKPALTERLLHGEQFSSRVVTLHTNTDKVAAMANFQPVIEAHGQTSGAVLTFREMGEVGRLVNRVIGVQRTFTFEDIVGTSVIIEKTKELARVAAGISSNILIQGETGTGKEVFAQAIHNTSQYSEGPFLAVNCAAIPHDLIESELFGYVEGAFTGASRKGRLGKFELASGGSIFLDEIGEMSLEVQVKLLRVLQEKAIVRVGGDRTIPINCRVITATNRDLHKAVEEGRFRRDLLYRLDVITIEVPPLRERQDDIPLFFDLFIQKFSERNNKIVEGGATEIWPNLMAYSWPGNVRELENAVEHAVALAKNRVVIWDDMPAHMRNITKNEFIDSDDSEDALGEARHRYDLAARQLYIEALEAVDGEIPKAAKLLGMSRATFYRRIKVYELQKEVSKMRIKYQS